MLETMIHEALKFRSVFKDIKGDYWQNALWTTSHCNFSFLLPQTAKVYNFLA